MPITRTPHSPPGANASFDLGPAGELAGFAVPSGSVPAQQVFIGCRSDPRAAWNLLPFFRPIPGGPQPLPKGRYGRFLAWAGDKWMIGPLVFKLCTPFHAEPAEDDRFSHAPIVCGYLEYDNSHSPDAAELIFGVDGDSEQVAGAAITGFMSGHTHGLATPTTPDVSLRRGRELFGIEIGPASAVHFAVPPHAKRVFPLVFGFFQPRFHYGRHFPDLTGVLTYGLAEHARYLAVSDQHDAEFMRSAAAPETKTRVALETRAWLAHSRRLEGEPAIDPAPLRLLQRALA